MKNRPSAEMRLTDRLALRPKEAAEVLGISERHLRTLLPEIPHLRRGNTVLIPISMLEEWLRTQAESSQNGADALANEILEKLHE